VAAHVVEVRLEGRDDVDERCEQSRASVSKVQRVSRCVLVQQRMREGEKGKRACFESAKLVRKSVRRLARRLQGVLERPDEDALEPAAR